MGIQQAGSQVQPCPLPPTCLAPARLALQAALVSVCSPEGCRCLGANCTVSKRLGLDPTGDLTTQQ